MIRQSQVEEALSEVMGSELDATRCGPLYERVPAPGGLGSCALVVDRATLILLELIAGQRGER